MKQIGIALLGLGIFLAVAFVPVLFLGSNWPAAGLITPLVCGGGNYQILSETTVNENATRARNLVSTTMSCVNENGEENSIGGSLLIIATVPAVVLGSIGIALLNADKMMGGFGGMNEMAEIAKVPEVKAQLDALLEDFKANRLSYQDYMTMTKNIVENYKARQASSS